MSTHVTDPADAALLAVLLSAQPPPVRSGALTEKIVVTGDGRVDWGRAVVQARALGADYTEILVLNLASNLSAPDIHDHRVVGGFCLHSLYTDLRRLGLMQVHGQMVAAWLEATCEAHPAGELAAA